MLDQDLVDPSLDARDFRLSSKLISLRQVKKVYSQATPSPNSLFMSSNWEKSFHDKLPLACYLPK